MLFNVELFKTFLKLKCNQGLGLSCQKLIINSMILLGFFDTNFKRILKYRHINIILLLQSSLFIFFTLIFYHTWQKKNINQKKIYVANSLNYRK